MAGGDALKPKTGFDGKPLDGSGDTNEKKKMSKAEKKKEEEMVRTCAACVHASCLREVRRRAGTDLAPRMWQSPEDIELRDKLALMVERAKDADPAIAKAALESMR